MFDKASLKLGLDKAVLQSMGTGTASKGTELTNANVSRIFVTSDMELMGLEGRQFVGRLRYLLKMGTT